MRDAFGGVFTMRLMIVFIFILVAFTAISLNYAKAFRIKNKVIDVLEQEQVADLAKLYSSTNSNGLNKINAILATANYNKTCSQEGIISSDGEPKVLCYRGIIIEELSTSSTLVKYNVKTYAGWDISSLNLIVRLSNDNSIKEEVIGGTWEINGEANVRIG